jgi:DNA primase
VRDLVDSIAEAHLTRVNIKEDFIAAACPFHKGGQESHPSFWINRDNGYWGCFSCSEGGDIRSLLKSLGIGSSSIESFLEFAEKEAKKTAKLKKLRDEKRARREFKGTSILPDALLGVFDWLPVSLVEQGFKEEVLRDHDVGYDQRNDRITFPIRDLFGNLIGISGRATMIGDEPKYLVYNGRHKVNGKEVNGELGGWYPDYSNEGIKDHLWRMEKTYKALHEVNDGQLIIVEGYKAALWMVQHGWTQTVALMGARMSAQQERIVRSLGCETFVLLDNNKPGRIGAWKICRRLAISSFPVYRCKYPAYCDDTTQPDDLNEEELEAALCTAQRIGGRRHVTRSVRRLGREHRRGQQGKPWARR